MDDVKGNNEVFKHLSGSEIVKVVGSITNAGKDFLLIDRGKTYENKGLVRWAYALQGNVKNIVEQAVQNGITEADLPVLRQLFKLPKYEGMFEYVAVVYGEAGDLSYPKNEWIAVAWVIRNRVDDRRPYGGWPNTYLGVVSQSVQFDAYGGGKFRAAMNFMLGENKYPADPKDLNKAVVLDCLEIALGVRFNVVYTTDLSPSTGCFFFNANGYIPAGYQRVMPPTNWYHQYWFK